MYKITIDRTPIGDIVIDGEMEGAVLHWHAPNQIEIYVRGAAPVRDYGRLCNIAVNEGLLRGIPALYIKRAFVGKSKSSSYAANDYERKLI